MHTNKPNTFLTTSSIFIVVLMIGLYSFIYVHPQLVVDRMKEQLQLVVEMNSGHNIDVESTLAEVKEIEEVRKKSIRWIPSTEAEREMRYEMGPLIDNLEGQSPFRDLIVFSVQAEFYDAITLEMVKQKVKKISGVDELYYQEKVSSQLEGAVQNWSSLLLYGGSLFVGIALILIYNTLRLSLFADRNSIMTLDLMGARKSFIKKPYLKKSFKNGFIIGFLVVVIISGAVVALSQAYPAIWNIFYESSFIVWSIGVVTFSILFDLVSTWVILSSFLSGRLQYL